MRAMVAGVWSALCTPWAMSRLGELSITSNATTAAAASGDAHAALRWAQRTLAFLARMPGGHWRTTCLYRSVAECLALRAIGVEARLAIGVSQELGRESTQELVRESTQELVTRTRVVAHAWVENASGMTLGSAAANRDMTPLRPAAAATAAAAAAAAAASA